MKNFFVSLHILNKLTDCVSGIGNQIKSDYYVYQKPVMLYNLWRLYYFFNRIRSYTYFPNIGNLPLESILFFMVSQITEHFWTENSQFGFKSLTFLHCDIVPLSILIEK